MKNQFSEKVTHRRLGSETPALRRRVRRLILEGLEQRQLLAASILNSETLDHGSPESKHSGEIRSALEYTERRVSHMEIVSFAVSIHKQEVGAPRFREDAETTDRFFSLQFNRLELSHPSHAEPRNPDFKLPPSDAEAEGLANLEASHGVVSGTSFNNTDLTTTSASPGSQSNRGNSNDSQSLSSTRSNQNQGTSHQNEPPLIASSNVAFAPASPTSLVSLSSFAQLSGANPRSNPLSSRVAVSSDSSSNAGLRSEPIRIDQSPSQAVPALIQLGGDFIQSRAAASLDAGGRIAALVNTSVLVTNASSVSGFQINGSSQVVGGKNRVNSDVQPLSKSSESGLAIEFPRSSTGTNRNTRYSPQNRLPNHWLSPDSVTNGASETEKSGQRDGSSLSPLPIPRDMVYLEVRSDLPKESMDSVGRSTHMAMAGLNPFGLMQTVVFSHQSNAASDPQDFDMPSKSPDLDSSSNWMAWLHDNSTALIVAISLYATYQWSKPAKQRRNPDSNVYRPE